MVSMFSIGMMVGGISPNMKIASIVASILYFPMIIFSGATLPYEIMPKTLQRIANIMPLTEGIKLLKATFLNLDVEVMAQPLIVMIVIAILCVTISIRFF